MLKHHEMYMKNNNQMKKSIHLLILFALPAFLTFTACKSQPSDPSVGQDHQATSGTLKASDRPIERVSTVWRGPDNGKYDETGLLNSWPEEGPVIAWSFEELGQGHSSPVVANNAIYTSGLIDGTGYIFKFDMDGSLIYKKAYGPEYTDSFYGPRGTPVIAGDKIYFMTGYGKLRCMNEADASLIWEADMVNDFGGKVIRWGYNETPVIDGDVIFCTPGGKNSVAALNRHTGETIWTCSGKGELSAYCTPLLFMHNGRKILATHTESHLLGINAETGDLLWAHKHPNQYSVHPNTPIYHDGGLFYFSGYGKGSGKIQLSEDGSDVKKMWENPMDSRMGGAVFVDGYIYGSGDKNREWRCIDWETGADSYAEKTLGKGVTIYADGKLYCYSDRGELAMVRATPENFDVLSQTRVTLGSEQHWAHPVIEDGMLYLRHGEALIAYKIK